VSVGLVFNRHATSGSSHPAQVVHESAQFRDEGTRMLGVGVILGGLGHGLRGSRSCARVISGISFIELYSLGSHGADGGQQLAVKQ